MNPNQNNQKNGPSTGGIISVVIVAIILLGLVWLFRDNLFVAPSATSLSSVENVINTATSTLGNIVLSSTTTYTNNEYGFSITYPSSVTATTTFAASYLLPNSWDIDAAEGTGEQILDLRYPGSNDILATELRIGASDEPAEVQSCDTFQYSMASSTEVINGQTFYVSSAGDAAMSHFSNRKSYRIVHNNTCFAIDVVSFGTNPDVYDPPATVPFDQKSAEAALESAMQSFAFTR